MEAMARKRLGAVIAVGNQKGGVGKSTNTVNLAAALGLRGFKSLIIDLDPHAGSTINLGVPVKMYAGTLELLTSDESPQSLAICAKLPRGVHLIPSRSQLAELDNILSKYADRTRILERAIALARPDYDFIWLDTPPHAAATTTVAAYSSAEWFLISAFPHPLSLHGINEALKEIADVRRLRNPDLEILGVLLTCVDTRTRLATDIEELIQDQLPGRGFRTFTTQATAVNKASEKGKTLFQVPAYARHKVTLAYRNLAIEIEHRVKNREAFLAGTLPPPALLDAPPDDEQPVSEEEDVDESSVAEEELPMVASE
jgi:chromosome partitioning protein